MTSRRALEIQFVVGILGTLLGVVVAVPAAFQNEWAGVVVGIIVATISVFNVRGVYLRMKA
ncbi:hypothetical protein BH09ACT10_BH09ACT10_04730 [soil metagenome]